MKKKILVPSMVADLVRQGLLTMEGVRFTQRSACPSCQGVLQGYDYRRKRFATLVEDETARDIQVIVKRFVCRSCGGVSMADAPFYPATRHGAPVVDFALVLSRLVSYREASRVLAHCHIEMDWGTIRHYATRGFPPAATFPLYGVPVPLSLLYLSILGLQIDKGGSIVGTEALAACRLPPAHGALFQLVGLSEDRDERNKQEKEKDRIS
ncbi:MAG: hypothetical protein LUO93_04365 [Methanomicrobiales archaeon]|nr:hypothetical protein [Methanomicrobiales archaeon]